MSEGKRSRYLADWYEYDSIKILHNYFARKAGTIDFVSENSLKSYTVTVKEFVEYSGFTSPDDVLKRVSSREMLRKLDAYIGWCNSKGNAPATQIRKYAQVINHLTRALECEYLSTSNSVQASTALTRETKRL